MKTICLALGCALLALSLGSCSSVRARAYGGYMQPQLKGTIALAPPSSMVPAIGANLEDAFGAGAESSPYGRVELGAGITNLTVSAFDYKSSGPGTLNANFGSLTVGTAIESDVKLLNIKSAVTFDLINVGPLRIAPGVAVDYVDLEVVARATAFTALERLEVKVPAPLGYVQGDLDLGWFGVTADFGAMRVNLDQIDGNYMDFEGLVHVSPLPHMQMFGGYRWITLHGNGEVDSQPYDADVELGGWFVGGGFSF